MANLNTGFETIRNNTALKHDEPTCERLGCFETIRNNTALKHEALFKQFFARFETIRNNTALKQVQSLHQT